MKRYLPIMVFTLLSMVGCSKNSGGGKDPVEPDDPRGPFEVEVGKSLPKWQEGVLDIHAINTGKGECTFIIAPDGTTMLVDAGDLYGYPKVSPAPVDAKPKKSSIPYIIYAHYIKHFIPKNHTSVDYFLLSHFHIDHLAYILKGRTIHAKGNYAIAGPMGIYTIFPFDMAIDRLYPDYSASAVDDDTPTATDSWEAFIKYNVSEKGLKVARFEVGTDRQIVQKYNPEKYKEFSVFGYAASGVVWNGSKTEDTAQTNENALSCAFLMRYGKFDYYTSGDLNVKTPCSKIVSAIGHPVEAMKAHHHMSNIATYDIESDVFKPKVVVTQSFYVTDTQPQQSLISKYSSSQDMFFTNIDSSLVEKSPDIYKDCKSLNGHIVIRVQPGGDSFYVYTLDDSNEDYIVKSINGPYLCE